MTLRQHWSRTLLAFTGLAAMGTVWAFMFVFMMIYTLLFFALWDSTPPRSAEDGLARIANLFFYGPGLLLLPLPVLAINGRLFVRAARARANTVTLPWKFAIAGFVFMIGSYALMTLGVRIGEIIWSYPIGQSEPGLYRSVFPVLLFIVSLLLYVKLLLRFGRQDDTSAGFGATPVY